MEKVIQSRIYIAFILSIRPTLKFSRHRLEKLLGYCLGHIMQHYYSMLKTQKKELVESEMKELKAEIETQKAMFYLQQQDRETQKSE